MSQSLLPFLNIVHYSNKSGTGAHLQVSTVLRRTQLIVCHGFFQKQLISQKCIRLTRLIYERVLATTIKCVVVTIFISSILYHV